VASGDSHEPQEISQLELVVDLYKQERSAAEIHDLMGIPYQTVNGLVRVAGVMRTPTEAVQLASRRFSARSRIARLDIVDLAGRWVAGAEVETLADEACVPTDLLWDALAEQLSTKDWNTRAYTLSCVGACSYGCTTQCAQRVLVGDRAKLPGSFPPTNARRGPREGVPYARTGLRLPEPGPHPRWNS
jgi:hypothetical protein